MKAIIDSNIFVMCMNPVSDYYIIFRKLILGNFKLCVTTEITLEYLEVFQRKFNTVKSEMLYKFLHESNNVIDTEVFFKWNLILTDPDDNKYVDCYIASNADYLVTNDKHFDVLAQTEFPPIRFVDIDEFVKILMAQ
jgi:predicted nucleic acid-binding protein